MQFQFVTWNLTLDILHPLRMPLWRKVKSIQTLVFATKNCNFCNQEFNSPCCSRKRSGLPLWVKSNWNLRIVNLSHLLAHQLYKVKSWTKNWTHLAGRQLEKLLWVKVWACVLSWIVVACCCCYITQKVTL